MPGEDSAGLFVAAGACEGHAGVHGGRGEENDRDPRSDQADEPAARGSGLVFLLVVCLVR